MSNLDDDDSIKQFFKKVARQEHIDYDERDWQKMEKMLDAENAREAAIRSTRWRSAAIGFALLSLALLTYFFISMPETSSPSKETAIENSARTNDSTDTNEKNDQINSDDNNTASVNSASQKNQKNVSTLKNALTDVNRRQSDKLNRSISTQDEATSFIAKDYSKEVVLSQNNSTQDTGHLESEISSNEASRNDEVLDSKISLQSLVTAKTDSMEVKKDTITVALVKENNDQVKDTEQDKPLRYSRWSVSLAVAPDFSSTEFFDQASAGSAFGITVQYEFYKGLSLQTGALITNKKYWNMGDEYTNIRPGYWIAKTNGVIPERIDGGCHVVEIPLALRYTMLNRKSNLIHFSAGVSSYVMIYETYHFTFEDPNPTATRDYESSETRSYYLSMGSVSLSYERMIHPKLAIGIEPYMKIPFTEIGWAKLPLYTTGAYLTLRYRFTK
jgi:hypothetical protein